MNLFSLVKMIFPLLMVAFPGTSSTQYYLVVYLINIVGFLFSGGLLIYHGMLVSKGSVTYDKKRTSYGEHILRKENPITSESFNLRHGTQEQHKGGIRSEVVPCMGLTFYL